MSDAETIGVRFVALFGERAVLSPEVIATELALFDPELADAEVEVESISEQGVSLRVRAAGHSLRLLLSPEPFSELVLEPCLQLAHYEPALKEAARAHRSHVVIDYVGRCDPPLVAHVVVAAVAGVLASLGAMVIVHPTARTSVPGELLQKNQPHMVAFLSTLPPLFVYAGFAKYEVEGRAGVWMRTHGNHALGLPDLARLAPAHDQGEATFAMFCDTMRYLLQGGVAMSPGDVAQIGEGTFTAVRLPTEDEPFLAQAELLLVIDVLTLAELEARSR